MLWDVGKLRVILFFNNRKKEFIKMAKKVKGEDGKMYKVSKPFYKRIWVWVLIVVVVFFGIGIFSEDEEAEKVASEDSTEQSTEQDSEEDPLDEEFVVGDTVSYKGVELTVNDVEFREPSSQEAEINEYDLSDGNQMAIVNVTLKNSSDESLYYNMYDFRLNSGGNAKDMDLYADDESDKIGDGNLDENADLTGDLIGQANPDDTAKLQYQTDIWNDETVDINLN